MKPLLKAAYLEKLFSKNPRFAEYYTEETGTFRIPAEVTEWDPPSTEVKVYTPKKLRIPQEIPEARATLAELAEAIPKKREELQALINQYNGIRHLNGLQSKFPEL